MRATVAKGDRLRGESRKLTNVKVWRGKYVRKELLFKSNFAEHSSFA